MSFLRHIKLQILQVKQSWAICFLLRPRGSFALPSPIPPFSPQLSFSSSSSSSSTILEISDIDFFLPLFVAGLSLAPERVVLPFRRGVDLRIVDFVLLFVCFVAGATGEVESSFLLALLEGGDLVVVPFSASPGLQSSSLS